MIATALLAWFALLSAIQFWLTGRLVAAFHDNGARRLPDGECPRALAVLCLRGTDPFLPDTLARLARLDYPDYTLRIVIDSPTDPAIDIVRRVLHEHCPEHVEVQILGERRTTCSGKISGVLWATDKLESGYEVVAIFDGDAAVPPDCLRELVGALMQPGCGIATGNRWYSPRTASFGSLTRYFWNAFAVPIMYVVQIPWGGCMALRAESLRDPKLRGTLALAFGEDSTLATCLRRRGLAVRFVPAATIANQEEISLPSFANFLLRQLLTVRLCNPRWLIVVGHMLVLNLTIQAGLAMTAIPFALPWEVWSATAAGLTLLTVSLSAEVALGHCLVQRALARRGERLPPFSLRQLLLLWPALVLTNVLNLWATFRSVGVRDHLWRGIHYRFGRSPRCMVVDAPAMTGDNSDCPVPRSTVSADVLESAGTSGIAA